MGMITEHFYNTAMCLTKVSILLLYRRIASRTSRRMVWTIYILIALFVAFALMVALGLTFGCRPFNSYWLSVNPIWRQLHQGEYTCWDEGAFTVALSVVNMMQDLVVYVLPMPTIYRLKISRREKIALVAIFGVGFL